MDNTYRNNIVWFFESFIFFKIIFQIDFFETEQKESAGAFMLKMWTEQEQEDATIADLLYTLGGLGLQSRAEGIISIA